MQNISVTIPPLPTSYPSIGVRGQPQAAGANAKQFEKYQAKRKEMQGRIGQRQKKN
jgi:hypothetical protein